MESVEFGDHRIALRYGKGKIYLHLSGEEIEPHAYRPVRGSADLCFIVDGPID